MINEKHKLGALLPKISKQRSFDFYCSSVNPVSKKYGVTFVEMLTGAGYYQWRLNGDGWIKFSDANENIKPFLAQQYEEKKNKIKAELGNTFFKEDIFIVPDESFIFFCEKDSGIYEFAIAAWGFKYPNHATGGELDYWVQKIPMQDVNIAFEWNGKKFPNIDFWFNNLPKKTESDGWFHLGGKVPVGTKYNIVLPDNTSEILVVEQDKSDYIYDLTQYFDVGIAAVLDGNPLEGQVCELFYNQNTENLSTDSNGKVSLRLPLVCDNEAQLKPQQPLVKVVCREDSQEQTPTIKDEKILFNFEFFSPKPPEPEPEPEPEPYQPEPEQPQPEPEFVSFCVLDYGGYPMPDLDIVLTTKIKGEIPLKTDSDGVCKVSKEWLEDKEKINVKFTVSDEYQKTHDIHSGKKRKKK